MKSEYSSQKAVVRTELREKTWLKALGWGLAPTSTRALLSGEEKEGP